MFDHGPGRAAGEPVFVARAEGTEEDDGWLLTFVHHLSDHTAPTAPVLASTFDTVCSAAVAPGGPCDPGGTYSVHNVVVEDGKAHVSWYWDGMLVLDVSDPYNPVELARFVDSSSNAGAPNDFWGVYKVPDEDEIYASDRNGGLYVFKDKTDDVDDDDDEDDVDDDDDEDEDHGEESED